MDHAVVESSLLGTRLIQGDSNLLVLTCLLAYAVDSFMANVDAYAQSIETGMT